MSYCLLWCRYLVLHYALIHHVRTTSQLLFLSSLIKSCLWQPRTKLAKQKGKVIFKDNINYSAIFLTLNQCIFAIISEANFSQKCIFLCKYSKVAICCYDLLASNIPHMILCRIICIVLNCSVLYFLLGYSSVIIYFYFLLLFIGFCHSNKK